jgi:polyhydroxyalkanoate synthesis regulator phasin
MIRKWLAVGLVLVAVVGTAFGVRQLVAKDEAKADEPKKLVDEMMAKLKAEDYQGMMEAVRTFNGRIMSDEERKAADNSPAGDPKLGAGMIQALLEKGGGPGKFTGEVEVIGKEGVGSGCVRYLLLQRFDRGGLVYKAIFYRTARGWWMSNLDYDTNLLNYLKPVP